MIKNLTGKTVGVFEVLGDSGERRIKSSGGGVLWNVRCSLCKKERKLAAWQLRRYQSCGCITRDLSSKSLRKSLNRGGYGDIYATHWNLIKKNAAQRNLRFDISVEYAWNLFLKQNRKCALSGVDLQFSTRCWTKDTTASLDRINSDEDYVEGNVQWVHKEINMMKQQYSTEKFFGWCKRIVEYNNL